MVNIPKIDRTTLVLIINVIGVIGAGAFIGAISFGIVQPSLPLYLGVGAVWITFLLVAVYFFTDNGDQ